MRADVNSEDDAAHNRERRRHRQHGDPQMFIHQSRPHRAGLIIIAHWTRTRRRSQRDNDGGE